MPQVACGQGVRIVGHGPTTVQAMPQVLTVHAGVMPHAGPKRVSGGVGCTAAAPAAWPAPAWAGEIMRKRLGGG